MVCTDRYCHSGPGKGDNSILTKLSVMPVCYWMAVFRLGYHRGSMNFKWISLLNSFI